MHIDVPISIKVHVLKDASSELLIAIREDSKITAGPQYTTPIPREEAIIVSMEATTPVNPRNAGGLSHITPSFMGDGERAYLYTFLLMD
ncbi:hypothetical protein KEJ49_06285 [Candidatus Bathyarchaeota archaeon]|nr:hypothetical protein [Candidatus Bathyarchaeota archaeon]